MNENIDIASLWQSYQQERSVETRNKLAEYYLPLIKIVAGRLAISLPAHVDQDDLMSSGFFGLLDAIDRYDYSRKNKFETYASVRVRGAMLDYLRSKDWLPIALRQKIRRYEQAVYALETELGRSATDDELAAKLNMSVSELHDLLGKCSVSTIVPLDEYIAAESPDTKNSNPAFNMEQQELKEILGKAIDRLPKREKQVVSLFYYEELTRKEISLILQLSEARISQLHTKAVFRLRGYLARMKASLL